MFFSYNSYLQLRELYFDYKAHISGVSFASSLVVTSIFLHFQIVWNQSNTSALQTLIA